MVEIGIPSGAATLLVVGTGVDGGHLVDRVAGIAQFGLEGALAALGRVKEGAGLLHLAAEGVGAALGHAGLLGHLLAHAGILLEEALGIADLYKGS